MAGKGWLGLLPYICIGIILISNQKKENQESAWILSNDLLWAIKSSVNRYIGNMGQNIYTNKA